MRVVATAGAVTAAVFPIKLLLRFSLVFFAIACASTCSFAQAGIPSGAGSDPFPSGDDQWHLGYDVAGYSDSSTYQEVESLPFGDNSASHPQEANGVYTDKTNRITVGNPATGCQNDGPSSTNACVFTTRNVTWLDDHHVRYYFKNWGGRCHMWMGVNVYAPTLNWKFAPTTPWSEGSPFIVVVPENASNPIVFGKLRGANIFFVPSDPLSAQDAQNFKLLEPPKVVPGLGTIYRFATTKH